MKRLLAWVAKLWYIRAERRIAKRIELLTEGRIAGKSARALARTWLEKRLKRHQGVSNDYGGNNHD